MKVNVTFTPEHLSGATLKIFGAYEKTQGDTKKALLPWSDKDLAKEFLSITDSETFTGTSGSTFFFTSSFGESIYIVGLGDKSKLKSEGLRKAIATAYKDISSKKYTSVALDAVSFNCLGKLTDSVVVINESVSLTAYKFDKYLSKKTTTSFKEFCIYVNDKKIKRTVEKAIEENNNITDSMNYARDLGSEVPNVLHSEEYAKRIEKDVKQNLKGVKTKILGKAEIKKEGMGMFLSVNAGSAHGPRLVHLTYTPKKATKNTKHIAMVGKA